MINTPVTGGVERDPNGFIKRASIGGKIYGIVGIFVVLGALIVGISVWIFSRQNNGGRSEYVN
jgi:hypothetical protein